jgi:hypothetical protein
LLTLGLIFYGFFQTFRFEVDPVPVLNLNFNFSGVFGAKLFRLYPLMWPSMSCVFHSDLILEVCFITVKNNGQKNNFKGSNLDTDQAGLRIRTLQIDAD